MKKNIFTIACLCFSLASFGQRDTVKYETTVVPIVQTQEFYLDSRAMSTVAGRSRLVIPVRLPEGTERWYYSFAASNSKNDIGNWISLGGQLTKLVDKTGIGSVVIDQLVKPTGSAVCDVFVLEPEADIKAFEEKDDTKWTADRNFTRQSIMSGIVDVTRVRHQFFLCFSNPSLKSGINVKVEVTAITGKLKPIYNTNEATAQQVSAWTTDDKLVVLKNYENLFFGKAKMDVQEVCVCMLNRVTPQFSPADYAKLPPAEAAQLEQRLRRDCLAETQHQNLAAEQLKIGGVLGGYTDALIYEGKAQYVFDIVKEARLLRYSSPELWNAGARASLVLKRNNDATEFAELILLNDSKNLYAVATKAHALLLKNELKKAESLYADYKGKKMPDGTTFEDIVSRDFQFLIKNKIFSSYYDNIKKKLKIN
jgi:hypothetical protein